MIGRRIGGGVVFLAALFLNHRQGVDVAHLSPI
jgi:hypothetical protein